MILPTHYTKGMANEIIQTMHCQHYVIKPMDAWKGMGIIFVEQKELERTLEKILDLSSREKNDNDETYVFWSQYKKPYFLIESLETSQPVTVNNKSYDATMRVAFGLAYDHGTIVVDFLGAYWKLPEKSLHEDGSLGEIYKSHIKPGICSAEVDKQTYEEVKTILRNILPKVYTKMIIASYSKNQPYSQQQDALTL